MPDREPATSAYLLTSPLGRQRIIFAANDIELSLHPEDAHILAQQILQALPTTAKRKGDRVTIEMGVDAMTVNVDVLRNALGMSTEPKDPTQ